MLIGYNCARPTKENYSDFERKLISGLKDLAIDGLSLMVYGSYIRGDMDIGRSDIDAVLTFTDDVVIDKESLHEVGKVLHRALKGNPVPFQVSVTDLSTMRDGRFNTYDVSFKDYFEEEGRILVGPDHRRHYSYELPTVSEQTPVRFNLRKSRIGLLFAEHHRNEDYESYLSNFMKTLNSVTRGSKQVLFFLDGTLRKNRFAAVDLVKELFPGIDAEPLVRIKKLYHDPSQLDCLYKQPDNVMDLWNSTVTFFEQMIREYIRKVPKQPVLPDIFLK